MLDHLADPAAAVDATVLTGVVVETGGRLSAAHPLIGAAAVESLPPGRRAQLYRRFAGVSANPERYAHFAALAAAPGPDGAVAEALDAAAAAAHARAANAAAAQFAAQAVLFTPEPDGGCSRPPPDPRGGIAVPGRGRRTVAGTPGDARHRPAGHG